MHTYIFIYRFRSLPGIEALIYTQTTAVGPINQVNIRSFDCSLTRQQYKHLNQLQEIPKYTEKFL